MSHCDDDSDGIERLRRCIRDLTAISLLPAIWKDYGPQQIAQSLCETLRVMNDAAFVSISLDLRNGQPPLEILCTSNDIGGDQRGAIQVALSRVPQPAPREAIAIANPFGTGFLRIVKVAVGFAGAGSLIIGSSRLDFPTEAQRLVLGAAASELATGLHRWHAAANEWRFVSLVDKSSDFIGFAALDGVIRYVNPFGIELVGLGPLLDFGHLNILDFFDAQNRDRVRDELWPLVLREGRWVGEIGLRHFVTGAIIPLLHEWFVIDDMRGGQRLNVATVSRDLSARVRWEAELRDLNTMLEHRVAERTGELAGAKRRLVTEMAERERADAQRQVLQLELFHASRLSAGGQMAAAFAHELNQPLAAATILLSTIKRLLPKEPIDVQTIGETLDEAGGQMRRAGQIIRRLRDFITRGECEKRAESVVTIVAEARALALISADAQGVAIRARFDPDLPRVLADRIQIQQVVFNLMRNAIEVMAGAQRREIELGAALHDAETVVISVADRGPGLPRSVRDRLFEPFVTTKRDGMGLGLSICRSIVEAHGGRIWSVWNPGGGTAFEFTLPAVSNHGEGNGR